ncbi:acetylxylan esterase [Clostridia bacterium]|nr:acetylxylan esterase [Clostridia bacterium]
MLKTMLADRHLPGVWDPSKVDWPTRRREIVELLGREEYGFAPPKPDRLHWEVLGETPTCAGKATHKTVRLIAQWDGLPHPQIFSFPLSVLLPTTSAPVPYFILLNFRPDIPDQYLPVEEIIDNGFGVLTFCYADVASDNGDFSNGLSAMVNPDECGKLALWAWAASRVLDYALTLTGLDHTRCAVVGHSRLGKAALWAAAVDERFPYAISNDSGCSGAALARDNTGETVEAIVRRFPFWFNKRYHRHVGQESQMPFDQHFLLAAIAPRKLCVTSAEQDLWADPKSEFLSFLAASSVYEELGMPALPSLSAFPKANELIGNSQLLYHMRPGTHYLSREDWAVFMDFLR